MPRADGKGGVLKKRLLVTDGKSIVWYMVSNGMGEGDDLAIVNG